MHRLTKHALHSNGDILKSDGMTSHFMLFNRPFACPFVVFVTGQTCTWSRHASTSSSPPGHDKHRTWTLWESYVLGFLQQTD